MDELTTPGLQQAWAQDAGAVARALEADLSRGLPAAAVRARRKRFGANQLLEHPRRSLASVLWAQLASPLIGLLAAAGIAAALWQEWLEAAAIALVVLVNTAIGFATELRAVRSMEALFRLGHVRTRVRRDGAEVLVDASELVPGDVVLAEAGDVVTADLRIAESSHLQVDESMLTGESMPVDKDERATVASAPVAERSGMLFKGTAIVRGSALGLVVSTGMATELGQISGLVREATDEPTPLERHLAGLGRRLLWLTLAIALAITLIGILGGRDILLMVETGVALAIATIPEGLPVVATVSMARGIRRMARRRALIRRLGSVETLGSTSVILTDKTGTLTENRMSVAVLELGTGRVSVTPGDPAPFSADGEALVPEAGSDLSEALRVAVLCTTAHLGHDGHDRAGDPMELALLEAARAGGLERDSALAEEPQWDLLAFDPDTQRMTTRHHAAGGERVAVKGSPEAVLAICSRQRRDGKDIPLDEEARARWMASNRRLADSGYRVLALATRLDAEDGAAPIDRDLTWIGLVGLIDPPRAGVEHALATCKAAGISVVMVTGDQAGTARTVAQAVGLEDGGAILVGQDLDDAAHAPTEERLLATRVFARVAPRHKLDLVRLYQRSGYTVAMTGDGVNDAPALRQADIGIAMGARGTEVAKEASDMILEDDSFATIVAAVQLGRTIFDNIRAFVVYLLSCNVSEVMVVALGSILGTPLPVLPLQLLFLNFVTDVFPALALGMSEGSQVVMHRAPRRRDEPIVTPRSWAFILTYGTLITTTVLAVLLVALRTLDYSASQATTLSFLTLALAQLWHVFNMRERGEPLFSNRVTRNPWVWGALALCIGLLGLSVYVPELAHALSIEAPDRRGWVLALSASLVPLLAGTLAAGVSSAERSRSHR
ncbi:MAG: cation-transporting P-type ATPase [Gemmatimonadota bacterium]